MYRLYANKMEDLINERKIDFARVSTENNAHHTGNYYIIAPNAFSMEGQTLISKINSIFRNLCDSN